MIEGRIKREIRWRRRRKNYSNRWTDPTNHREIQKFIDMDSTSWKIWHSCKVNTAKQFILYLPSKIHNLKICIALSKLLAYSNYWAHDQVATDVLT